MTDLSFPARRTSRALAVLVLCALVIASALAGAAGDRFLLRANERTALLGDSAFHPLSSALRAPTPTERRELRTELTRELGLTPAQDSAVNAIMVQRSGEFQGLREAIRPRVDRLVSDVRQDIEQVLTPDQRVRFRALQQREHADALGMIRTP
jgi:Spy/CpxP family protein refolding chaperone